MRKLRVGIIGCGTIGSEIARSCTRKLRAKVRLIGISDIDLKKARALRKTLSTRPPVLTIDALIVRADLVIEAASAKISATIVDKCIRAKRDCLVMSVGGLIGKERLLKRAEARGTRVYLPSGALCGIDGLKSASCGTIRTVTLTTRKPPQGLKGAPYLRTKKIDLESITGEKVIFDGNAEEAIEGFPQNVNVSAVLSLAGIGAKRTRVRIITSPGYTSNVHEVEILGTFGRIVTKTENVPSKTNPKTSALAIFSAIATLHGVTSNVRIGT